MLRGTGCATPPLGRRLSDSEEHAHTVQRVASAHPLSVENSPLQLCTLYLHVSLRGYKGEMIMESAGDGS